MSGKEGASERPTWTRRNLWSSSSWKALTIGLAVFVPCMILVLVDEPIGIAVILAATAAGVVAYAVLVHEQVAEARRALLEQREANVKQEMRSQEQIEQTREQLKLDSERVLAEAEQWRQAEQRSKQAQLDAVMPTVEIRPVSDSLYGLYLNDRFSPIEEAVSYGTRDSSPPIMWEVVLKLHAHGSEPVLFYYDAVPGEFQLRSDRYDNFSRQGTALLNPSEPETLIWRHRANPTIWANYLRDEFPNSNGNWMTFTFDLHNLASTVMDTYRLVLRPRSMQVDGLQLVIDPVNVRRERPTYGQLVKRRYRFMDESGPRRTNETDTQ